MTNESIDVKDFSSTDQLKVDTRDLKRVKFIVYKNIFVIGSAWVFLFTAYTSISNLQSSLNSSGGLGTASLSTLYVALIISCIFIPTVLIDKIGTKWTIVLSQLTYILYMIANIYPTYYTLIPTAIILGSAPLWTAKCTFLTDLGTYYSLHSGETSEVVINRFFGIFFAMFQSGSIWGNIISSTVLKPESNSTVSTNLSFCGINDCPGTEVGTGIKPPLKSTVYLLCGIYVGCALVAVLITSILVDSNSKIGLKNTKKFDSPISLLINTLKHIKEKDQLLIIPLTLWSGFEQAYIGADFTKSFISCIKGIDQVGLVMITYGVADTLGSYLFGYVIKYTGRLPIFILAATMNFGTIIFMIFWTPNSDNSYFLFLIALVWGLADAVWQTQINAFYGVIFQSKQEAAFSNYRLWESMGFVIAYAYSNFLCVRIKLFLLIFYLTCGMIGYGTIEFRLKNKKNKVSITSF